MSRWLAGALMLLSPAMVSGTQCSISVADLPFPPYNPTANEDSTTVGEVRLTCGDDGTTETVNYSLSLNGGSSGNPAQREMTGMGPEALSYNVYTSSAYTVIWGDGTAGTMTVDGSITPPANGSNSNQHLAHGRVPAGQNAVSPGEYGDVLTLQINF